MDSNVARGIAHSSHLAARDSSGVPVIEHVERVAAMVPEDVRSVAFLHDVIGRTSTSVDELCEQGLTPLEKAALLLLTREPGESYELHALRIAWAGGTAGAVARAVKLADLDDHLSHGAWSDDYPPYAWARRHIVVADERLAA
jgi:hypothetical protein